MKKLTAEEFRNRVERSLRKDKVCLIPADTFVLIIRHGEQDLLVLLQIPGNPVKIIRSSGIFTGITGADHIVALRHGKQYKLGVCLHKDECITPIMIGDETPSEQICIGILAARCDAEPFVNLYSVIEDTGSSGLDSQVFGYSSDSWETFSHTLHLLLLLHGISTSEVSQAFVLSGKMPTIEGSTQNE